MKEEVKLFLQKLAEDKDLQEKMKSCKSPEEAYAIARSVQDGFTLGEFTETMAKLKNELESECELTDDDLAKVAGGANDVMNIVKWMETEAASCLML